LLSRCRGLQYWVDEDSNRLDSPPTDFKYLTKDVIDDLVRTKLRANAQKIEYEIPIDNIGKIKFDAINIADTVQLDITSGKFYVGCSIVGTLVLNNGVVYPLWNPNFVAQFDIYLNEADFSIWARFRGFSKLDFDISSIDSDAIMTSINDFFENNVSYTVPNTNITVNFYSKISQ